MQLKGDLVAAYARYSSDRQNESSVEDQLRRVRAFLAGNGRELSPELIFTDPSTPSNGAVKLQSRRWGRASAIAMRF
jgi:DNA invertase Pin-like site-specific DNA recombinase